MMNFYKLSSNIKLDPKACQVYQDIDMLESNYLDMKTLFYDNQEKFFEKIDYLYPDGYRELLYLYIKFAIDLYPIYQDKGINEDIYFDTMSDISVWAKHCYEETGVWGIKEKYWLAEHMKMRIFKLGRLQFQPIKYQKNMFDKPLLIDNIPIKENTVLYYVHIQEGESISYYLCQESYKKAKDFFSHDNNIIFLCDSWLLSPRLKEILKPVSNIIKFASNYTIFDFDNNSNSIHKYLRNTKSSLLEAVKKYETENKKIGTALGYYNYK